MDTTPRSLRRWIRKGRKMCRRRALLRSRTTICLREVPEDFILARSLRSFICSRRGFLADLAWSQPHRGLNHFDDLSAFCACGHDLTELFKSTLPLALGLNFRLTHALLVEIFRPRAVPTIFAVRFFDLNESVGAPQEKGRGTFFCVGFCACWLLFCGGRSGSLPVVCRGARVRRSELQNVIERSVILCETENFSVDCLHAGIEGPITENQ